jgi:hypothetical protein
MNYGLEFKLYPLPNPLPKGDGTKTKKDFLRDLLGKYRFLFFRY